MGNVGLSAKQRAFIAEYMRNGFNSTEAYLSVAPNVTRDSAGTLGASMLKAIKKKTAGKIFWAPLISTIFAWLQSSMSFLRQTPMFFTRAARSRLLATTALVLALTSFSQSYLAARSSTSTSSLTCRKLSCNYTRTQNETVVRQTPEAMGLMASKLILTPTRAQSIILASPARFKLVNAGRRFGKTHLAIDFYLFPGAVNLPGSNSYYIAPTYKDAKRIAWEKLKDVVPLSYLDGKPNETELSIRLRNRSKITLLGADDPDSLRGPGAHRIVYDEFAFQKRKVWDVTRPMLSDTGGDALFISTPSGYNHFYDMYCAATAKRGWAAFQFTTLDGGNVSPEEIEEAKHDLDERIFRQEYEASFEMLAGRVYYAYSRDINVCLTVDDKVSPLLVGMDFNVNPMTAAIAQRKADQLHFIDEIVLPNGNTELMAAAIKQRYPGRKVNVYPDPTGNARKTSAPVGQTDFTILRGAGFTVLAPQRPYPISDKYNTFNASLCNAAGERRAYINPVRCPHLAKGLDGLTYREGTSEADKSLGLDHITDAAAYLVLWEMPMRGKSGGIKLGAA